MPTPDASHEHRAIAESFGEDAARYDRARPRYPDALIAHVLQASPGLGASPGRDVLDVGCGTGIVARQLRDAGATVLGVDPDPRMAAFARATGVPVEVATFEAWDPAGRTFDAVVAAQAWHWIDPAAGAARAAAVLRPGGVLALFWHVFVPPAPIADALATAFARAVPDSPIDLRAAAGAADPYGKMMDLAADGLRAAGAFGAPERTRFTWEHEYTRDAYLDLLPTQGPLTRLPADTLAIITDAVGAAIDALGGSFVLPYRTVGLSAAVVDRPVPGSR